MQGRATAATAAEVEEAVERLLLRVDLDDMEGGEELGAALRRTPEHWISG